MKKLIAVILLSAGISMAARAQIIQKSPEQRAAHITRVLQKTLNLTADQATQINAAFFERATRMDSLKSSPASDKRTRRIAKRSIVLKAQSKVMAVLNNEQQQLFMQWENKIKEKHSEKKSQNIPSQG